MNTIEEIKTFKELGFTLVPLDKNKKPKAKRTEDGQYSWKFENKATKKLATWSDDELLKANGLGVSHGHSGVVDVDFDNPNARLFVSCFPHTFTLGKQNGSGIIPTHVIYKSKGKKYSYPKNAKQGSTVIELLTATQTVLKHEDNSRVIIAKKAPIEADYNELLQHVKLTAVFAELYTNWPKEGQRDEAWLRLAGAFARDCSDVPRALIKKFMTRFLEITNDHEVDNRLNKLEYQDEQMKKDPEAIVGIHGLSKFLGVNLPAFDEIKDNVEEDAEGPDHYPLVDMQTAFNTEYPKPKFVMEPILRERTVMQISGDYGAGKSMFGLYTAMCVANGWDFLDWKFKASGPIPVLYVEGELPASDIQDRLLTFADAKGFNDPNSGKKLNYENFFQLTLDDLELNGHKYGFDKLAISNEEDEAIKGRLKIENTLNKIKERLGKFPILFLDNISALTAIDENKATDWSSLMMWLMNLKTRGIITVFFHHTGKSTGTASGSNMAQRLIDTHIILKKLPENYRFNMQGRNVQCSISFDKFRNFGGEQAKSFLLTCSDQGNWKKYPMLDQKDFKIIECLEKGMTVKAMCEEHEELKEKTVYRRIAFLKKHNLVNEEVK
jgi:hypothetical protein